MSVTKRRVLLAVNLVAWAWWGVVVWVGYTHNVGAGHHFAGDCIRVAAFLLSFFTMLAYAVPPALTAMKIGREAGRREGCTCQRAKVIPINRVQQR